MRNRVYRTLAGISMASMTALIAATSTPAYAQSEARRDFNIPSQPLAAAIIEYSRQSDAVVTAPAKLTRGKTASAVRGSYTPREALMALLAGTGLTVQTGASGGAVIVAASTVPNVEEGGGAESASTDIVVTGSLIRGAPVASQVIVETGKEMRDAGFSDLGEAMRNLPQSFGGGQNPGIIANTPNAAVNTNVNSGSSLNLRGLGPDATLTLLNGRRLAYSATNQAVDISVIPFAAVDRVEIVADGASALYGSDAVGGVANVILKRDFDGLDVSSRFGATTDGGGEQVQLSAVSGAVWPLGGAMFAYNYNRGTQIRAGQRRVTSDQYPGHTVYPSLEQHSAVAAVHHDISNDVEISADATISSRTSRFSFSNTATEPYTVAGNLRAPEAFSYSISPKLRWNLSSDWMTTVQAVYAEDNTGINIESYAASALTTSQGHYDNAMQAIEVFGEGSVISVPAGNIRLAVGGGYRRNEMDSFLLLTTPTVTRVTTDYNLTQNNYFAYGELFAPIVSSAMQISGVHKLSVSAALRYEKYSSQGELATPKFGVIYAPISALEFKASWGKSFKAPTLHQRASPQQAYIYPIATYGGTGPGTAFVVEGGNPNLGAEKATSWSVTAALTPDAIEDLKVEATYFNVKYRDRIARPISASTALSNPTFSSLITQNPSQDFVQSLIDSAVSFNNVVGGPIDFSAIRAFVDTRWINVAQWSLQGIDVAATYRVDTSHVGSFTFRANGSYLDSSQQITPDSPSAPLAGQIFQPTSFRARGSVTWDIGDTTAFAGVNFIKGVEDRQFQPAVDLNDMATVDLTLRHSIEHGALKGLRGGLTLTNIFNTQPERVRTATFFSSRFDSLNYSPIGRFVSLEIGMRW